MTDFNIMRMSKVFEVGDEFTYLLTTNLGDFKLLEKLDNRNILLYYKVGNFNEIKSDIDRAIIIPTQFVGFEQIIGKQYWKSKRFIYNKPFDFTFNKYERNVSTSVLHELDSEANIERKNSIEAWRLQYEKVKNFCLLNDEFCRLKTNYYKYELPLLKQTTSSIFPICDRCVGYGFIPLYFGIGLGKNGLCYKCGGRALINYKTANDTIIAKKIENLSNNGLFNLSMENEIS